MNITVPISQNIMVPKITRALYEHKYYNSIQILVIRSYNDSFAGLVYYIVCSIVLCQPSDNDKFR